MKIYKIFQYAMLFGAALMINACAGEEEDIFDQSAAERLNTSSDKYSSILEGAKGGWVVEYYPTNSNAPTTGEGYLWLVKFFNDQQVLVAMNNQFSNNIYAEDSSAWEVITDNGPVLSFNSFNKNVHSFSDPDVQSIPGNDDSVWGVGVGGDYEFVIVDAPVTKNAAEEPFVMLKGKKRGTYNRMTQLPDTTNFQQYLADVQSFQKSKFSTSIPNKCMMTIGEEHYYITNAGTGIAGMYLENEDPLTTTTQHPFMITKRDGKYYLRFRSSMKSDDITVQEFVYNKDADRFEVEGNDALRIEGEPVQHFFVEQMNSNSHRWQWTASSDMSDSFATLLSQVVQGFRSAGYTFTNMQLRRVNENVVLRIQYRQRSSSSAVDYIFSVDEQADGVVLKYVSPVPTANNSGERILTAIPVINDLFTALSQKVAVTPAISNFNLSTVKLAMVNDNNTWFNVTWY